MSNQSHFKLSPDLIYLLDKNGYSVYQTNDYFVVRKQVFASWGVLGLFLSLGILFFSIGVFVISFEQLLGSGLLVIAVGLILIFAPFFNYLTAAYRSLVIDKKHKTILFRAGFSRAYLFTEVKEMKLEVQDRYADANAFSDSNKEFYYTISAYMERGDREELLTLKFRNEDSERLMFDLKDYMQTLLTYNR